MKYKTLKLKSSPDDNPVYGRVITSFEESGGIGNSDWVDIETTNDPELYLDDGYYNIPISNDYYTCDRLNWEWVFVELNITGKPETKY